MASNNGKRVGDRKEGRLLRALPPTTQLGPYIATRRSDSCNCFSDSIEVTEIEQWLLAKRDEGSKSMNLTHLMLGAYVRTVSMRPGINRFVAGRRIFARNDIQIVLRVRRGVTADAPWTSVKVFCSPTDTVYDIYRRVNDAVDDIHSGTGETYYDRLCAGVARLPRMFMRWCMGLVRMSYYFDWLPKKLLDGSPLHGSLAVVDLGSLGIQPVSHHINDFGSLPCYLSFGAKRRSYETDSEGKLHEFHFVDYRITCDERIVDGSYYAGALKCMKYFLKNPQLLELPPERVEEDGN